MSRPEPCMPSHTGLADEAATAARQAAERAPQATGRNPRRSCRQRPPKAQP